MCTALIILLNHLASSYLPTLHTGSEQSQLVLSFRRSDTLYRPYPGHVGERLWWNSIYSAIGGAEQEAHNEGSFQVDV